MAKRFGRTLVSRATATEWRLQEKFAGSDHAHLAGNCQRPVMRPFTGLRDKTLVRLDAIQQELDACPWQDYAPGHGWKLRTMTQERHDLRPVNVDIAVRCRKCPACLKARAAHWRMRAIQEWRASNRTWFGTLTLRPEEQFSAISRARHRLAGDGIDFDALCDGEQFAQRHKEIGPELTRFVKRLRKQSGVELRFLLVAEAHKSGAPHYHMLIHETGGPVRHRALSGAWRAGFSNWKLVHDEGSASYVCKYLSKSALARVRASKLYGETGQEIDLPQSAGRSAF